MVFFYGKILTEISKYNINENLDFSGVQLPVDKFQSSIDSLQLLGMIV